MNLVVPKLICFDLDGTLIDTAPDLAYAIDTMMETVGLEPVGEQRVRTWIGNGMTMLVKRALTGDLYPEPPALYETAWAVFQDIYQKNVAVRSRIYPGVVEGLRRLKEAGFIHACVTNKQARFANPLMEQIGLAPYFDCIGCGDQFRHLKPHPIPLLKTAQQFDVEPANSMMVGDSANDMGAAHAAGFMTVFVPYGYDGGETMERHEPDAVIDTIADLPALLDQLPQAA